MKENLTIKQQKLVLLLKQELQKQGGSKTLAQLMIMAGYSPASAESPSQKVLNSPAVKNATKDLIQKLEEKANQSLDAITLAKLKKASARDNAYVHDITIKNKQLLTGKATENKEITIQISEEVAKKNE